MSFGDGRIASAFKKVLAGFGWGGDLIPDADDSQSIGSAAIGLEELHIATDFLITQRTATVLQLRNSANTLYQSLDILGLEIFGELCITREGSGFIFGNVDTALQIFPLTTAQKEALTEQQGQIVFDTDLDRLEHVKDGANWESLSPIKEHFWGVHSEDEHLDYAVHSLVGALKDNYTGKIPGDFIGALAFVLVLIPQQDTINLSWTIVNAEKDEVANTHVGAGNINTNVGGDSGKLKEIDILAAFGITLGANNYFGIELSGSGGNNYKVLGIRLRYR